MSFSIRLTAEEKAALKAMRNCILCPLEKSSKQLYLKNRGRIRHDYYRQRI